MNTEIDNLYARKANLNTEKATLISQLQHCTDERARNCLNEQLLDVRNSLVSVNAQLVSVNALLLSVNVQLGAVAKSYYLLVKQQGRGKQFFVQRLLG